MKEGTRERLRKRGKAQAVQADVADTDTFHNHQVPCGRLLQECTRDIFPENSDQASSLLGSLIRRHFRESKENIKKKKKRKKKKTSDQEPEPEPEAAHVENPLADHNSTESQHETTDIMNKWLDRVEDSCPENRDLSAFLQHVQLLAVKIDASRLQAACESISCLSCQHATRQSSLFQNIPIGPFGTFKTFVPSSLTIDGGDVERAFDYVAMEEGDSEEIVLVLHRNGSLLECDSVSLAQLEQCIRQVVIPCGLPELEESNARELSEQEFLQLTTNGNHGLQKTRVDLDHISNSLSRVRDELEESATAMTGSFDVKTSTVLRDCDAMLDGMLHDLVILVRHVPTSLDDGKLYHSLVKCLSEAISAILQAQESHEGRLVQLANRPGAVPQMALSATHRSSYRDFLSNKLEALAMLESQMESLLLRTHVYRSLVGYAALEKLVNNSNARQVPSREEDLLWQLYEEQTHTVQCGNIRKIKETRSQCCHDLMKAISRRRMARCHDISEVIANKKAESPEFQETCEQLFEYDATGEEFPQHRQHVISMFASEVAGVTKPKNKIVMPLKLKQWVRGDATASCFGGGGRQRVTCTVMGLLYKWLVDRCNEWHAELTHIELLESVMGYSMVPEQKSKGKKSKKKKKAVDQSQEASRPDVANGNLDRSSEGMSNEVVIKSGAGVKSTDADDLSVGKQNNENSPGPQHSLSTAAMVSTNCKKDGSLELDVRRDKNVVLAAPGIEKTKKSFPSHDSCEQGLSDTKVASALKQADRINEPSPIHVFLEPRIKSDKKVAAEETRDDKAKTTSLHRESREPRAESDIKVVSTTAQVKKTKKASLSQRSREGGTKGDKELVSAVKEANMAKQSSPSGAIREPREKSGKKAAPTTQVICGESKQPSPIQGSGEAGASDERPASAAKQVIDGAKQPSPSHDSCKQRAKGGMKSLSTTTRVHSGEKEQSPIQGTRETAATDEKAVTAETQGEKIKQSWPRDEESRGKSGKKSVTKTQIHSGESKEESPIEGSRETGAADEKAASATVSGANETKKATATRRKSGAVGKKLALVATQVDSEKVESSPSRASYVGVVSPTGFQSAEVFLVERLMVVLHAETHEKMSTG